MCGYYYSSKQHCSTIKNLQKRGPEDWQQLDHPLGFFGHSLLNTIGEKVKQPVNTSKGCLLYNGSVYNFKPKNDTKVIADNLTDNLNDCVEFIKTLNGEYSITWVTDQFVIFCTDQFGIRPLFYFNDHEQISISSLPDALDICPAIYKCEENKIYVYNKKTKGISVINNTVWNLSQTDKDYDRTWTAFEQAVKDRHDNSVYALSGGYDSGVIACCVSKFFKDAVFVNNVPNHERNILLKRRQIHEINFVNYKVDNVSIDKDNLFEVTQNAEIYNEMATSGQSSYIVRHMIPQNKKVLITGDGADEVYADYGFKGKKLRAYSKFGGYFPDNLHTVWPWHNHQNILSRYVQRTEVVGGYWGIELRLPLLDKRLVQAWLRTTAELKNKEYKGWMAQYMTQHDYPFELTKTGYADNFSKPLHLTNK